MQLQCYFFTEKFIIASLHWSWLYDAHKDFIANQQVQIEPVEILKKKKKTTEGGAGHPIATNYLL